MMLCRNTSRLTGRRLLHCYLHQPLAILTCTRASIQYRSLPSDDPFGEQSSWDDPADGMFGAWKDISQEGFAAAVESDEVRQAHFGPEWARFSTVGRMAIALAKEGNDNSSSSAEGVGSKDGGADGRGGPAVAAARQYPTPEEMHERRLARDRKMMERNYTTYEAFVEAEFGGGGGGGSGDDDAIEYGDAAHENKEKADSGDCGFRVAVDGVSKGSPEVLKSHEDCQAAADAAEAAELDEDLDEASSSMRDVPGFFSSDAPKAWAAREDQQEEGERDYEGGDATSGMPPTCALTNKAGASSSPTSSPVQHASSSSKSVPVFIAAQIAPALGPYHGDPCIPFTDPLGWDTDDIVAFLSVMEQHRIAMDVAARAEAADTKVWMDECMINAFHMAAVTGEMLLTVVPPRMFRAVRQWHVRREEIFKDAWRRYSLATATRKPTLLTATRKQATRAEDGETVTETAAAVSIPSIIIEAAVADGIEKLDDAAARISPTLVQETVLLCFPYGSARAPYASSSRW